MLNTDQAMRGPEQSEGNERGVKSDAATSLVHQAAPHILTLSSLLSQKTTLYFGGTKENQYSKESY